MTVVSLITTVLQEHVLVYTFFYLFGEIYCNNLFYLLLACSCNTVGTSDGTDTCADDTGVCTCAVGFTGDKCDSCDTDYYGVPTVSCTACTCSARGTTECDSVDGTCTCDTGYTGATCDSCDVAYYDDSTTNLCEGNDLDQT